MTPPPEALIFEATLFRVSVARIETDLPLTTTFPVRFRAVSAPICVEETTLWDWASVLTNSAYVPAFALEPTERLATAVSDTEPVIGLNDDAMFKLEAAVRRAVTLEFSCS